MHLYDPYPFHGPYPTPYPSLSQLQVNSSPSYCLPSQSLFSFSFLSFPPPKISCMLHSLPLPVLHSIKLVLLASWIIFWFSGLLSRCDSDTFFLCLAGHSLCGRGISSLKRTFLIPVFCLTVVICFN